jgi:hypothetical protein
MRLSIPFALVALICWTPMRTEAAVADACVTAIPSAVARALTKRFPVYRLPRVADSLAEDVRFNLEQGGTGCQLVATGDFDGDGIDDFAVGLLAKDGNSSVLAVALARKGTWQVSKLTSWFDDANRLYVGTVPPGIHRREEPLEGPLAPNERSSLRCEHVAVIVGTSEATGIVYCYVSKRWLHVRVLD